MLPTEHTIKCDDFGTHTEENGRLILFFFNADREAVLKIRKGDYVTINGSVRYEDSESVFNAEHSGVVTDIDAGPGYPYNPGGIVKIVQTIIKQSDNFNSADYQYLYWVRQILERGRGSENRTATNTRKLFGEAQMHFDLRKGFPLLTTKKVNTGAITKELLWFNRGETNIKTLGSKIWDEWATEDGELGPVYGAQWRNWSAWHEVSRNDQARIDFLKEQGYTEQYSTDWHVMLSKRIDQIDNLINELKTNPNNRRMLITAWNPAADPDTKYSPKQNAAFGMQALPPCHTMWQVGCTEMNSEERFEAIIHDKALEIMANVDRLRTYDRCRSEALTEIELLQDSYYTTSGDHSLEGFLDSINAPEFFLDLKLYQRSADWFLGVPFNIASYAEQAMLLAKHCNMVARDFYHTFGDFHIYDNHVEQLQEQLKQPMQGTPYMRIAKRRAIISDYRPEDFQLLNYNPGIVLKGDVAV